MRYQRTRYLIQSWVSALFFVLTLEMLGFLGQKMDFQYEKSGQVILPQFAPPWEAFSLVWPFLLALMGLSAWEVWRRHGFSAASWPAWILFAAQLLVNMSWRFVYFEYSTLFGFFWTVLLMILVAATVIMFFRMSRLAGLLLLPYLAWVVFGVVLAEAVWVLTG